MTECLQLQLPFYFLKETESEPSADEDCAVIEEPVADLPTTEVEDSTDLAESCEVIEAVIKTYSL